MRAILVQLQGILLRMRYLLPMIGLVFIVRAVLRHKRGEQCRLSHEIYLFLLYLALAALFSQTILSDISDFGIHNVGIDIKMKPFGFVRDMFYYCKTYFLINIIGNIAFFVLIGALFALVDSKPSLLRTLLFCACVSLAIELTQLYLPRCTDIDDLILNTFGGLPGYYLHFLFARKAKQRI